jgi:hypothetical protein
MSSETAVPDRFIDNPKSDQISNPNYRSKSNNTRTKSKKEISKSKSQIKQFIDKDKQK